MKKKKKKLLNDEKINKNKEIIDLKTKLITCDKFKEEINNINNKYSLLEKQIYEKDKEIEELKDINNDLKDKLDISNENYDRISYENKNLEMKLNDLMDKAKKYENMLRDSNNINSYRTNKKYVISNMYYNFKNKIPIRNFSFNLKKKIFGRISKNPGFINNN